MFYPHQQPLFRIEYNGCKSYGCPNCGRSDLSLYQPSERLGYPAYHCPLCDAYPPVLLNEPILALNQQLVESTLYPAPWLTLSCDCKPDFAATYWSYYGRTQAGSQRFKCQQCGTVKTEVNGQRYHKTLQPWLEALIQGVQPADLQQHLNINSKLFYQRLVQLSELLEATSRKFEHLALAQNPHLTLQTRSHILECRSGFKRDNSNNQHTHLWLLSTAESHSGYQLFISDNLLTQPYLERYTNAQHGQYVLANKEVEIEKTNQVLLRAERTYQKILARSQFDQFAYTDSQYAKNSEGIVLRPVYAAHAHMQHIKHICQKQQRLSLILEHESFIRGSAIFAFMPQSDFTPHIDLFYIHSHQHKNIKQTEPRFKNFSAAINIPNPHLEPSRAQQTRSLSWWQEKWIGFEHNYGDLHWSVGIGNLTPNPYLTQQHIPDLLTTHADWQQDFWQAFDAWLPAHQRKKISHKYLSHWLKVFRFLYNKEHELRQLSDVQLVSPYKMTHIQKLVDYAK